MQEVRAAVFILVIAATAAGCAPAIPPSHAPDPPRAVVLQAILSAGRVRAGATVLVSLANDTWVSDAQFARMALDMVRVRAVEQRRWLVRASTWGPSALVDPFGRTTMLTDPDTATTLAGPVEPLVGTTPYARLGDAFAVATGSLYINTGALLRLENESQLAAILGHEGGHVAPA